MKPVIASLSKQSTSVIRQDHLQYITEGDDSPNVQQCAMTLYTGYILEGYKVEDDDAKQEVLERPSLNQVPFVRVDVVEIKRVVRFPKEHKFTVHLHRGDTFSIRCSDHSTFRGWTEEIRKMINLRGTECPQRGCILIYFAFGFLYIFIFIIFRTRFLVLICD